MLEEVPPVTDLSVGEAAQNDVVKDEMKRVKAVKSTEPIKNIIAAIDKFPILPIDNKTGIYLVDKDILIHNLAAGAKKK